MWKLDFLELWSSIFRPENQSALSLFWKFLLGHFIFGYKDELLSNWSDFWFRMILKVCLIVVILMNYCPSKFCIWKLTHKPKSRKWTIDFLPKCEIFWFVGLMEIFYPIFHMFFIFARHSKISRRIWSTWNWTLHKFLRENMQAGISNIEDINELIVWNETCVFRVRMTTVLIQKTPLCRCVQRLEVHAFWQKLCGDVTKSYLQCT